MLLGRNKIGIFLLAFLLVFSLVVFTGCGGTNLKGANIKVASWWQTYNVNTYEPRSESEEQELEQRRRLLREHDFSYEVFELSDWDNYLPLVASNIMSNNKDIHMYQLSASHIMILFKQGLLYPVSDSKIIDFNNRKDIIGEKAMINGLAHEAFTFGGKTYAWSYGLPNNGWGTSMLFFNPQHLEEVGLGREYLYDLQRDNNWTWDTFYEVCKRLTRDTTGNGVIDTYALPIDDAREFIMGLIFGNGGNLVTFDEQGRAVNSANSPAVLDALQFFNRLITEGLVATQPTYDWGWNWSAFVDGRVAMTFDPEWRKGQMNDNFEAGYVLPPRGPRSQNIRVGAGVGGAAIPNIFSPAEVDVILKADQLWSAPVSDDWLQGHYWASRNIRDVTETVVMSRDPRYLTLAGFDLVPGYPFGDFIGDFRADGLGIVTPAQHIESWMPRINAAIEDFNR
ncbi:MAG: extracellular solute-binding protein [Treponema sp.]|nr:extracellular solute-binding protein [Treponema sp.]